MARKKTAVHRCRCKLWQWGIFAVADGPGDQAVHAHQGCCRANEKSLLWSGALHLPAEQQQLHLPFRPATELWRTQRTESHLRLHRNPQEVRSVRTEIPVHDRTVPVSCNPHERNSSAASAGSPNYTGVRTGTATAKEGRGALRRTKELQSHRPPSAPAPQVEVRTRTVLPGGHCPEHQAAGPVPQPTDDVTGSRHFIEER